MDQPPIAQDRFGITADGIAVDRFTLRNPSGMIVRLITYGATVTDLFALDRRGKRADVVLGFDNLAQYESESPYFGCTVGRVAFRVTEGRFRLDDQSYQLTCNVPPDHLHGGVKGLSRIVWKAEPLASGASPAVRFTHTSPDCDQGYPGELKLEVIYTLTESNKLRIDYTAETDRPTPVNLTHHGYFNLAGSGDVLGHVLQLDASRYTPLDEKRIPTGQIASIAGTPFDFLRPTPIGARIHEVMAESNGYDLPYLRDAGGSDLARVATLTEPESGRVMEVLSTEPALILYTGNYLNALHGKGGAIYGRHSGVCLETAHLPDSVNRPEFPSIILRPGATYRQTCVYRFSTQI